MLRWRAVWVSTLPHKSMMRFVISIWPRKAQLDPQGTAIHHSLVQLGFDEVSHVTHGKQLAITVEESSEKKAHARIDDMCRTLLVNPITEDYTIRRADDASCAPQ